ncbi:MAG: ATP-binding protein [Syntrophomonadaceae bacterium]|nr:ATP-binding protein [Syntrophomonadaceae bacterium]
MSCLTVPAKTEQLEAVLSFVEQELEFHGMSPHNIIQIKVATEEMFVNIAHYAYASGNGNATIQCCFNEPENAMEITFIDQGVPYDPLAKQDPDLKLAANERPIGGLGIYIVKKTMDDVAYCYEGGKNIFVMKKYKEKRK